MSQYKRTLTTRPGIERMASIRKLLAGQAMTVAEISEAIGLDRRWVGVYLDHLRELHEVYISGYLPNARRTALYTLGQKPDAVRPDQPPQESAKDEELEMQRAIEVARKRALTWKPQRDPLIAAFFGGAPA